MTELTTHAMPAAVLWDMDGTLVDTEPYWMASEQELVRSFGGTWTHDDGLLLVGQGLWTSAAILQSRGVDLPADEIVYGLTERVREKLAGEGVPWRPGARELLQSLRERGVRTALVTMSVRSMAEQIVAAIPFDAFDVIVSGDEVSEPKPHPEPYLRAAQILGIEPGEAVATIGVPHIVPLPESDEHTLWESLDGRTADDIAAVAAAREEAR